MKRAGATGLISLGGLMIVIALLSRGPTNMPVLVLGAVLAMVGAAMDQYRG